MEGKLVNTIFALDIGTRTVVGVLGRGDLSGDLLEIVDAEIMEHRDRNMFDGQIHDINQVTEVVRQVKKKLEERNGCTLTHVSIAAAGRSLVTHRAKVEMNVEGGEAADRTFINSLELKAMQKAQREVQETSRNPSQYYCVGYSVVSYYLDGTTIKNLEGHRGSTMGVEVISTFLPRTVVDSLYTVMERAGLEVINLTLEPIAAIRVAIPENLRLLNLAMVDIGAGTSDIAITRDGTITAYSMVSIAGDEVTEEIAQSLLTDFNTAERIKLEISTGKDATPYKDVLGDEVEIGRSELLQIIRPVVEKMAGEIADSILKYNQGSPKAVFCIGGGSLTPGLKESLSARLGLPVARIGIKNLEENANLKISIQGFSGPEVITPAGIALAGYKASGDHFINISVNDKNLRMLNTRQMTISDALLAIGFNPRKLIPSRGESIRFYVNDEIREMKGEPGQPARIMLNGAEAALDKVLKNGDTVQVVEATEGKKASPTVGDVIRSESCQIILAGKRLTLPVRWSLNGSKTAPDQIIKDGDRLEVSRIRTLGELLDTCDLPRDGYVYRANGDEVAPEYILKHGDRIDYLPEEEIKGERFICIKVNSEEVKLPYRDEPYIFVDVFNFVDFDLSRAKGKVELAINGTRARYTDIIREGDEISIYWTKV